MNRVTINLRLFAAAVVGLFIITAGAPTAEAALQSFSPTTPAIMPPGSGSPGVVIGGIPAWYQDLNGVSVQPCLVPATCGLIGLGDPMFNEAQPLSYPGNFPTVAFYFDAQALFPVGPADARVVLALEFAFVDAVTGALIGAPPRPANALGVPFQHQSLILTYPVGVTVPAAGNFTITHPWGQTVFPAAQAKCVNTPGVGTKCSMTQDLPLPGILPPSFAAALGTGIAGSQSTFLKDPSAPPGFLSSGAAVAAFTGAIQGNANSISVADPLLNTGSTSALTLLVGQLVGLTAAPSTVTFTAQKAGDVSSPTIVTITNPSTVNPAILGTGAVTGADAADFSLTADTCSGATIPTNGTCTFGVIFTEPIATAVNGAKSAQVSFPVTPVNMPPLIVNLSGAIDTVPPTVTSTIPANNAINVPANNIIIATFSEPVSGVTDTTFFLTGSGILVTGSTVSFNAASRTATLTPATNLVSNATYTATIFGGAVGVTDIVGNPLAADFVFTFRTTITSTTPPAVIATNPGTNAVDVPVNQMISATFNEPVDPASVNATTFTLSGGVTGAVSFDPGTVTATFTPLTPLTNHQLYTATLTTGIVSLGSVPMAANFTWSFLVNSPIAISITKPGNVETTVFSNSYAINWTATPNGIAGITLGYDTTGTSACNGTQITSRITSTNGPDVFTWDITTLPEGTYHIYASISDVVSSVCSYAASPLIKSNANGDITGDGIVDIADALKVLRMAVGLLSPTALETSFGDVAPLVNGKPQPDNKIDLGDVVVILRKAVGLVSW